MKIWSSSYQLYPKIKQQPPFEKNQFRKGALLRVRFEDGLVGYADLCPFPAMGDRPVELELQSLAVMKPQALADRALIYARWDAEARAEKRGLYDPHARIPNHFLVADIVRFDVDRLSGLQSQGFKYFKIKLGRDLSHETEHLQTFCNTLGEAARVRVDFNAVLSRDRFEDWFERNQSWLRPKLDFIEDPFPYAPKDWTKCSERYGLRLALDLAGDPLAAHAEGAEVVVLKPARQDPRALFEALAGANKKFVVTHYMDFPLGQMAALVATQRLHKVFGDKLLVCGLQHHDLYEGFAFQDEIRHDGPYIVPPEGYGFGFDRLLESQKWHPLKT